MANRADPRRRRPAPLGERGQLIIPALFVFPIFFLIVMFLVETGNLSRQKIRQQFALDAAATVEMEQYTDLFNRMAYINGVFPHRIFKGGMHVGGGLSGLYPSSDRAMSWDDEVWPIRFGGSRGFANNPNPPLNFGILHMHPPGMGAVALEKAEAVAYNYTTVYRWLGDVATAQKLIFNKTVQRDHAMLRKSMFMNLRRANDLSPCSTAAAECGDEAAKAFKNVSVRMHYLQGWKHCPVIIKVKGQKYVGELTEDFPFEGRGLFQLITVPPAQLKSFEEGFLIKQHWRPQPNFFGVNFHFGGEEETSDPFVRAKVHSMGGHIWPHSTPKYITRLQP